MSAEPKLLTEAEWHGLLGLAYKHAEPELRERGLIAEPVDPLVEEADNLASGHHAWDTEGDYEAAKTLALAALRRGRELAERPINKSKYRVPEGQTPLDDNLRHKYLDVIKQGSEAFDSGAPSPYHGHSLEHCLHAIGWVQRDLRVALDNALARIERFAEQVQP